MQSLIGHEKVGDEINKSGVSIVDLLQADEEDARALLVHTLGKNHQYFAEEQEFLAESKDD